MGDKTRTCHNVCIFFYFEVLNFVWKFNKILIVDHKCEVSCGETELCQKKEYFVNGHVFNDFTCEARNSSTTHMNNITTSKWILYFFIQP